VRSLHFVCAENIQQRNASPELIDRISVSWVAANNRKITIFQHLFVNADAAAAEIESRSQARGVNWARLGASAVNSLAELTGASGTKRTTNPER
jgi:hypothetical protein